MSYVSLCTVVRVIVRMHSSNEQRICDEVGNYLLFPGPLEQ